MIKKYLAFILILFHFITAGIAQEFANGDSTRFLLRQKAEKDICLLKNKNNAIPIKTIDNVQIACISIGSDSLTVFQNRLSDYAPFIHYNLGKTVPENKFDDVKNKLKKAGLIICAIHQLNDNERFSYGITRQTGEMIQFLADSTSSIIVLFGQGKAVNELKSENAISLIVSPNDSDDYQDIAAQIILGGIPAKGKLIEDINQSYPKGFGLETDKSIRFKFTFAEEFGIKSSELNKKVDSVAELGIKMGAYPGCQILAAKDGKIFFHKTYGYHKYDSIKLVQKSDLYDFASITKIIGPLPAIMKLYEEKKINLDSKFSDYWTAFKHSNKKNIIIREALAHQAGFISWIPFWKQTLKKNGQFKRKTFKSAPSKNYPVKITDKLFLHKNYAEKIYKTIKKSKLTGKKEYLYSDLSFILYPKLIEQLSGELYENYIFKNFFHQIGANSLMYNPLSKYSKRDIVPTEIDSVFRKELVHGTVHDEAAAMLAGISGNAGLFGTTLDLAKIMQMYLNYGTYGGQQIFESKTIEEFIKRQFPENNNRRALGFDKIMLKNKSAGSVSPLASDKSFGHTGFTGTLCWADPENGLLYIFMSNRVHPYRSATKLFDLNIRPAIHTIFYKSLNNNQRKN